MPIDYSKIDWDSCLRLIYPNPLPQYTGKPMQRNQSEYQDERVWTWTDARAKPTWEQLCHVWATTPTTAGGGIFLRDNAPGDIKRSAQPDDHAAWLYVPPNTGRVCNRIDDAALFHVVGTAWNMFYPGIAATDFGLPIPDEAASILPGLLSQGIGQGLLRAHRYQGNYFIHRGTFKYPVTYY